MNGTSMKNTSFQTPISPILIIALIGFTLHLGVSLVFIEKGISAREYTVTLAIIYSSIILIGALMSQLDAWLTHYESNRYVLKNQKIQSDERLFEAVLKQEAYQWYKQKYFQDKNRKALLVKMVAQMQAEFEAQIRAEAKAIVDKGQALPLNNVQNSPIDSFLKKHSESKTSVERAAEIFKNNDEKTDNKPA
jgi:hypothetical protein